jgi:hypothetical protein
MIQYVASRLMNEKPRREQITRAKSIIFAHKTANGNSKNILTGMPRSRPRVAPSSNEEERRSV